VTPRIFLCEPSGLDGPQRLMSDSWHERLFGLGMDIEQLRSTNYEADPWAVLLARMRAAHGVVVLGFRQLYVSTGAWRPGTQFETDMAGTWSSPWLQIEVGLAVAEGLPLLVAPEPGVFEGAFSPETWTGTLFGTPMANPDTGVVDRWARSVGRRSASRV
jgi:hypothetical protein